MTHTIGSLFDGSGGFPLAGALCGLEPKWAAEVEPYPIAVTRSRFPNMKHLGDISKVNGAEIEPVDVITFGSPCQDLSVAGKRAGLKHEANGDEETTRSGLFMEAVRIIKEMRKATNGLYPRFALWENVPGAFSSNNGEDFRLVCEELIKIVEPSASMPDVPKNGWAYADYYRGDGWSLAYRVFDAQYWGVPQRRRRIHLVADFRGQCAREVLFEREGVRGYFAEGGTPWQGIATDAQDCTGTDDREGTSNGGDGGRQLDAVGITSLDWQTGAGHQMTVTEGLAPTLRTSTTPAVMVPYTLKIRGGVDVDSAGKSAGKGAQGLVAYAVENHPADSRVNINDSGKVQSLTSRMGTGGGNVPMVMEAFCKSARGKFKGDAETWVDGRVANTLNTFDQGEARANELVVMTTQQGGAEIRTDGKAPTLTAAAGMSGNNQPVDRPAVAYSINHQGGNVEGEVGTPRASGGDLGEGTENLLAQEVQLASGSPVAGTLMAASLSSKQCLGNQEAFSGDYHVIKKEPPHYIVRRLTPTECARLQGFADRWGDIDQKAALTEEELRFWVEVRKTHAIINGKKAQDYTEKQMLTWYNKLHTDSAEYKMWGNGIALPTALYCMQGITDALNASEDEEDWML